MASVLNDLRRESKQIRQSVVWLIWHMRGGLSREEAWTLSETERLDIQEYIAERIKIVEETRLPLL